MKKLILKHGQTCNSICIDDNTKVKLEIFVDKLCQQQWSKEQYWKSYSAFGIGGYTFQKYIDIGGTGIMAIYMWYHNEYKPGSREWRQPVILRDMIKLINME